MSRYFWAFAVGFLGVALAGCPGETLPPVTSGAVAVSGAVTLDGQPLTEAQVTLSAVDGKYSASGVSDASGKFTVKGDQGRTNGAPPGTYTVVVSKMVMPDGKVFRPTKDASPMAAMTSGAKEAVPAKYTRPAVAPATPLTVTVESNGNVEVKLTSTE